MSTLGLAQRALLALYVPALAVPLPEQSVLNPSGVHGGGREKVNAASATSKTFSHPPIPWPSGMPALSKFVVRSRAMPVRFGDITAGDYVDANGHPYPLPADVVERYADGTNLMGVARVDLDLMRLDETGTEVSLPLSEVYMHHTQIHTRHNLTHVDDATDSDDQFIFYDVGSDFRGLHTLKWPFVKAAARPKYWSGDYMWVHANGKEEYSQCPCTDARLKDPTEPMLRKYAMMTQQNDGGYWTAAPYTGGVSCCMPNALGVRPNLMNDTSMCKFPLGPGKGCADYPIINIYMRATFHYFDVPVTNAVQASGAQDDLGSGPWRLAKPKNDCYMTTPTEPNEYYIPQCLPGTPPENCVHTMSYVHTLCNVPGWNDPLFDQVTSRFVHIAAIVPHLHTNAISIEMIDVINNKTLCKVQTADGSVGVGTVPIGGPNEAGNELGFVTHNIPCLFGADDSPVYESNHLFRVIAKYNNSASPHNNNISAHGAMAFFRIDSHAGDMGERGERTDVRGGN